MTCDGDGRQRQPPSLVFRLDMLQNMTFPCPSDFLPCTVQMANLVSSVLNQRLEGRSWIMGETYTIADIATFPGCAT